MLFCAVTVMVISVRVAKVSRSLILGIGVA